MGSSQEVLAVNDFSIDVSPSIHRDDIKPHSRSFLHRHENSFDSAVMATRAVAGITSASPGTARTACVIPMISNCATSTTAKDLLCKDIRVLMEAGCIPSQTVVFIPSQQNAQEHSCKPPKSLHQSWCKCCKSSRTQVFSTTLLKRKHKRHEVPGDPDRLIIFRI